MKDRYIFPAVFDYADDGISVSFPDFPGCYSEGDDNSEAIDMAQDALAGRLYILEQNCETIPEPSDILTVQHEPNQAVVLVDVYMPTVRERIRNRNINKMCTVPSWLVQEAEHQGLNFSRTLQEGLMHKLGIHTKPRHRH